jgi:hypothetical protein
MAWEIEYQYCRDSLLRAEFTLVDLFEAILMREIHRKYPTDLKFLPAIRFSKIISATVLVCIHTVCLECTYTLY